MKTIRVRVLGLLGLAGVVLWGAAFTWYAAHRLQGVEAAALGHGEAVADVFGAALGPLLDRMDTGGIGALVRATGANPAFGTVAVVGRGSGRLLASEPPLPTDARPSDTPVCAACHDGRLSLSHARLREGKGGRRAQVFRPLSNGPSCRACHGGADEVLGYLFLDIPVASRFHALWGETAQVLGMGILTLLALLGTAYWGLSGWVVGPLEDLRRRAEAVGRGDTPGPLPRTAANEFGGVAEALESAAARERGRSRELRTLVERMRSRGSRGAGALEELRRGALQDAECTEAIWGAAGALDRSLGAIRSDLTAIASSTSDNSASLIELSASVDEVARSSDYLSQHVAATVASVDQMVASVVEVGDRVEVLAAETGATADAVAQISDSTRQIEQSAREGVQLSGRLGEAAGEGSTAVQATLEGIHASYAAIQETARAMGDLAEASQAIGGVVKIINEINDRTKLLALNAAIIAAQSGEHGKSFAVVAHEIKNLSDRTSASTGEIARLNRGIGQRMEAAAQAAAKGEKATAGSVALSERAGHALERILATARLSHDRSQSILRATEQQTRDSERVMASVQQVAALVGHIRNAAHEHRVTGEKVRLGAEEMRTLTGHVRLATAEQAEVSRYLSEAIATVDHNLKHLLGELRARREETAAIHEHLGRLREHNGGQEDGLRSLEALCTELQEQIGGLAANADESAGGAA